jgi:tRNA threonylcarbamoyladenosine biosynthesis protein TsaB
MRLLAFETARAAASVAVLADGRVVAHEHQAMSRGHAAALMPMIERAMAAARLPYDALQAIAVANGPGSFTGIRIGLSAAKGFALALGVPVVPVSCLEAEVASLSDAEIAGRSILVVLDSGRRDAFAQAFDRRGEPLAPPAAVAPEGLAQLLPAGPVLALGDGLARGADALKAARPEIDLILNRPPADAVALARRAIRCLDQGVPEAGFAVVPLYLRAADVTLAPALLIRAAGAFDLDLLAAIHAASFATPWDRKALAQILAMPGAFGLLAAAESQAAGFVLMRVAADEAEILSLVVLPETRRRGWGRALLEAGSAEASLRGARRLFLEVASDNTAARRLYEAAGFREAGVRPAYYREAGRSADALVLARALASG